MIHARTIIKIVITAVTLLTSYSSSFVHQDLPKPNGRASPLFSVSSSPSNNELLEKKYCWSIDLLSDEDSVKDGITSLSCISISDGNEGVGQNTMLKFYAGTKRGLLLGFIGYPSLLFNQECGTDEQYNRTKERINWKLFKSFFPKNNSKGKKGFPIYSIGCYSLKDNGDEKVAGDHHGDGIVCGGHDRIATVWEQKHKEEDDDIDNVVDHYDQDGDWEIVSELGPHTGWVKDIILRKILDAKSNKESTTTTTTTTRMYTIGCNCIETWERKVNSNNNYYKDDDKQASSSSSSFSSPWTHIKKHMVDSSPELGCTLSSDLLCLASSHSSERSPPSNKNELFHLFAGGVDGRIHLWSSSSTKNNHDLQYQFDMATHEGRVNDLLSVKQDNISNKNKGERILLFSCGHDSKIACRDFLSLNILSKNASKKEKRNTIITCNSVSYVQLPKNEQSDDDETQRILAMDELFTTRNNGNDDSSTTLICAGTSKGSIYFIQANSFDDHHKNIDLSILPFTYENEDTIPISSPSSSFTIANNPVIHEIQTYTSPFPTSNSTSKDNTKNEKKYQHCIVVGHSNGITILYVTSTSIRTPNSSGKSYKVEIQTTKN